MAAGKRDIYIEQGATFRLNLLWKDSLGNPVNLTGYSARMQVRRAYNNPYTLLSLTSSDGTITLGGSLGTIVVDGPALLTEEMSSRVGVYDLELESADGTVTRLLEGKVTISPEVTHD